VDEERSPYEEQQGSEHCPVMQRSTERYSRLPKKQLRLFATAMCLVGRAWWCSFPLYSSPLFLLALQDHIEYNRLPILNPA